MELDEQQTFKRGKIDVDAKKLVKYKKIIDRDWIKIKHKSVLNKLVGSSGVTEYFNYKTTTEKISYIIDEYFKNK